MTSLRIQRVSVGLFALGCMFSATRACGQSVPATSAVSSSSQVSSPESQYNLKLPVPLVIEDVVVVDSKNHPVRGLKASDFLVKENGQRVELRTFEEHGPESLSVARAPRQPLGANIFSNVPEIPPSASLTILLLDALNTPIENQIYVRQQVLKFTETLSPAAHVAIFGLGTRLSMLQGFTSDPALLRRALENSHGGPQVSLLLQDKMRNGSTDVQNDAVSSWLLRNSAQGMAMRRAHQQAAAHEESTMVRQRVVITLQALNQLARYLSVLPGHKNVIWFSAAFPINLLPNNDLAAPLGEMADFRNAVRETADLLARSRVAVFPVDARGIFNDPQSLTAQYAANDWLEIHQGDVAAEAAKHLAADRTYAERDTMEQVATATGGRVFVNTNGMKEVVDEVIGYGQSYYTLTYSPPAQKFDGTYRKITVAPGDPELHAYYRAGYFADDPNGPSNGKAALALNAMQTAMLHGVPDAIQVRFDSAFVPGERPVDKLTPGGIPDTKRMKPPYMSYQVQYIVDIRSVQFTVDAAKVHHGSLELASIIYDHDGAPLNSTVSKVALDLPDDRFAQIAQQGVLTRQTIDAPAKGEYYLRVGVHDLTNDHVGALEVPLAVLKSFQEMRDAAARQNTDSEK